MNYYCLLLSIACFFGALFLAFNKASDKAVKRQLRRRPPEVIESFNYRDFETRR